MDQKLLQDAKYFEQLALNLELAEVEIAADSGVSLEEARLRSEVAREKFEVPAQDGEKAAWHEEYEYLRTTGWPWRVAAFIAWSASPRAGRCPKTQLELAQKVLGLNSDRVIYTWRKKNPAIDEVIGFMQASPLFKHRRDFFEALVQSAADPDYKHHPDRKLALEMTGDHVPRTKVDISAKDPNDLSEWTDAELDELARNVLKKKEKDA